MKQNLTIRIKRPTNLLLVSAVAACFLLAPRLYGAAPTGPCSTNPDNRALDFWLGDWNIAGPGSSPGAKSSVTALLDKCIIVETWDGGRGHMSEKTGSATMRTIKVGTECSLTIRVACTSSSTARSRQALPSFRDPARERMAARSSIEFGSFALALTEWRKFGRSRPTMARPGPPSSAENTRERNYRNW